VSHLIDDVVTPLLTDPVSPQYLMDRVNEVAASLVGLSALVVKPEEECSNDQHANSDSDEGLPHGTGT